MFAFAITLLCALYSIDGRHVLVADFDPISAILIGTSNRQGTIADRQRASIHQTIKAIAARHHIPVISFPEWDDDPELSRPKTHMDWVRKHIFKIQNFGTRNGGLIVSDMWMQDYGPAFTRDLDNGQISVIDFNRTWYDMEEHDEKLAEHREQNDLEAIRDLLNDQTGEELYQNFTRRFAQKYRYRYTHKEFPFDLQGGHIISNGRGLCLVSAGILHPDRWPSRMVEQMGDGFTREFAEEYFEREASPHLGCSNTLFLDPLRGESTEHLDMAFAFISPMVLLVGVYDAMEDNGNFVLQERNIRRLVDAIPNLKIVRITMPSNCPSDPSDPAKRLQCNPAEEEILYFRTYVNAIMIRKHVIMPVFELDRRYEMQAVSIWSDLGFEVIRVDAEHIIHDGGAVHCMARFVPRRRRVK